MTECGVFGITNAIIPAIAFWKSLSLSSRTCFGITVLILSKNESMIWDERGRTVLSSDQRVLDFEGTAVLRSKMLKRVQHD